LVIHIDVGATASTPATLKSTSETVGTATAATTAIARLTTRATTEVTTAATAVATCTLWFHIRMLGIYRLAKTFHTPGNCQELQKPFTEMR